MDRRDAGRSEEALERLIQAVRSSYESAASAREANFRAARSVFESNAELIRAQAEIQAELNRNTLQSVAEGARRHRESFLKLSRGSLDAYDGFLGSLSSYQEELSRETGEPGRGG